MEVFVALVSKEEGIPEVVANLTQEINSAHQALPIKAFNNQ